MIACNRCGHELNESLIGPCPVCGFEDSPRQPSKESPAPTFSSSSGLDWIRGYGQELWSVLTRPSDFFRQMPIQGGLTRPLTFALITHWIGTALAHLWKSAIGGAFSQHLKDLLRVASDLSDADPFARTQVLNSFHDQVMPWIAGTGSVLLDPFITLFSILFLSLFVFIGARILVPLGREGTPHEIPYESAVRIICYSTAPSIFSAIPIFGPLLSTLLSVVISIIGAKRVYRVDSFRAAIIALFPNLLLFGIILMGLAAVIFLAVKIFTSVF